ncbi:MAG: hypothetical protein GX492_01845 [Firmicutes bacterium]|nr:hypothetical protein [Bacillota bacterium]
MIDRLKPYRAYKDSGVPWLGKVPEHWEVKRNKFLLQEVNERSEDGSEELLTVSQYTGVTRRQEQLTGEGNLLTNAASLVGYKRVMPGDLVMNIMLAWNGSLGVSSVAGIVSPSYCVFRTKPHGVEPRFLHYLFRTPSFTGAFKTVSTGVVDSRLRLYPDVFLRLPSVVPPLPEQTAIVRFLDWAERRIRRVIRARRRRIKLLEEYKQALIHQAVTGRIDVCTGKPYPAYKPSGVKWLSDVPANWEVKPVKRHYAIQLGKMLQTRPNNPDDVEVPYLKAQHIQWFSVRTSDAPRMWASPRDIQQFGITVGDLLVCEGGEGGRCGIVKDIPEGFIIQNALHRVRPRDHCRNDYLQYVMSVIAATGWFHALNNKATIAHFTREKFGALYIPIPSPDEQTAIVEYLDAQTAKIDAAIAAAHREIELLREYRTRVIADVVTGNVDVREVAARLPEEPPEGEAELMDTDETAEGEATDDAAAEAL